MLLKLKKTFFCFLISLFYLLSSINAQGLWKQKADFGGGNRSGACGFSINGKGYIGTGIDGISCKKDFWEFDTTSNTWTQKADFGGKNRANGVGFSIGNKGYIGTGDSVYSLNFVFGRCSKDFWEYNPNSNSWSKKADFAGSARSGAVGFSIGGKGYIGTGSTGQYLSDFKKDFWEFDTTTNKWSQIADFGGAARKGSAGFSIGDKGYIGGGTIADKFFHITTINDFWEYNPTNNIWIQRANFGGGWRVTPTGFSIGNKGYIGDGYGYTEDNDIWEWDVNTDIWTKKTNFPYSKYFDVAFAIGNKGYLGSNKDFWEFDPSKPPYIPPCPTDISFTSSAESVSIGATVNFTNTSTGTSGYVWQKDGETFSTSTNSSCKFLYAGTYTIRLIANGTCYDTTTKIINVIPGGWAKRAAFIGASRSKTVGFSIGNKAYIGTGGDSYSINKDFWEWDQTSNTWTQKADFGGGLRNEAVGFSIGEKGYIGTGVVGSVLKKDFWEYDPITNIWLQRADFGGTAREYAVGFSIGSKGYIGTGFDGSYVPVKDFWEFDPINNVWLQKADFGGVGRILSAAFSIGHKGYIGTGYSDMNDFWEWDQNTNIWTQKANFGGVGGGHGIGFSKNERGYIGGVSGSLYNVKNVGNDCWEYNPISDTWKQISDIAPKGNIFTTGFSIGNKGYAVTNGNDLWEYNPNNCGVGASFNAYTVPYHGYTDYYLDNVNTTIGNANNLYFNNTSPIDGNFTWQVDGVTFAKAKHRYEDINYKFFITGNHTVTLIASNGTCTDTIKQVITVIPGGVWSQKAKLHAPIRGSAVSFSIGNKGYFGTGLFWNDKIYDGAIRFNDFWEWDKTTNAWTQKANFAGAQRYNAVGFSIGNKGYIATGDTNLPYAYLDYAPVKDFWEYDPKSNVWLQKADFPGGNRRDAGGFSINGKGYIGMGFYGKRNDLWEYNPILDS